MDTDHRLWNDQQKLLRQALAHPDDQKSYLTLFLSQHAMVHSSRIARAEVASFEDEVWKGLSEQDVRAIPTGGEHSIVWCLWHLARIEDVSMNILIAGTDQLLESEDWYSRMQAPFHTTGNLMTQSEMEQLSTSIRVSALRDYRDAVGKRTCEIVSQLQPGSLRQKADQNRIQKLFDIGAITEISKGVAEYWGSLSKAGLLLMPPTRHNLIHLNEAIKIKKTLRISNTNPID
jgi:hypothetical protein